jgi:hypothetical protein
MRLKLSEVFLNSNPQYCNLLLPELLVLILKAKQYWWANFKVCLDFHCVKRKFDWEEKFKNKLEEAFFFEKKLSSIKIKS